MKLCEKIKELHLEDHFICIFSIAMAVILIVTIIVNSIHLAVSIKHRNYTNEKLTNLEQRIEVLEKN